MKGHGEAIRLVAIGGGTGLSTLLRGLRGYVRDPFTDRAGVIADLAAVVTVTDEGGSSGRLRREFGMLPPGDIRRCLVALSEDETLLSRLFEYRFAQGRGLQGHSLGNLFLTALTDITGDFQRALSVASEVLAVNGRIYPSTLANVRLRAEVAGGRSLTGETNISRSKRRIRKLRLLPAKARPVPETRAAIQAADLITIGPGSLFTSLIPNVLVEGLAREVAASRATRVYVGNLMTQPGESIGMTVAEHIRAIYDHAGARLFDYAILNDAPIPPRLERAYRKEGASQVVNDVEQIRELGVEPVFANLLVEDHRVVRHNSDKLAELILGLPRRAGP